MAVRFIHAADLHLGSPLKAAAADAPHIRDRLNEATYTAFERIVDTAITEAVDFLIVAGDLYDEESRSVRANEFLVGQLGRLRDAGIPVYVSYGNHDPVGSAPTYVDLPDNVHEFDHEDAQEFCYPTDDAPEARIWGQSYRDKHERRSMYYGFAPADSRVPNIGVLHTGLNPDRTRYVPVSKRDLQGKDEIHYWALGHVHRAGAYTDAQPIVYPGIPQGRKITEPGLGGCVLVELAADDTPELEFIPTSPIVWQEIPVDVGGIDGQSSIPDIQRHVTRRGDDLALETDAFDGTPVSVRDSAWGIDGYIVRWRLTGHGPAHETLQDEETLDALVTRLRDSMGSRDPFIWTETVRDNTGPEIPPVEELREDDRVIDAFLEMAPEFAADDAVRAELRSVTGAVWEDVEDHENASPDALLLTEETLDELIERARRSVLDELARRRAD